MLIIAWTVLHLCTKEKIVRFLDKNHTEILKGYAIIAVLFGHVGQYLGINGIEYSAGVGVSLFLILSGFGMEKSVNKSGVDKFWIKRFCRVFFPYIIAESVYMVINKPGRRLVEILGDFSLLKPLHPFGWYLHYIFICYIIFYLTILCSKDEKKRLQIMISCFLIWFLIKTTILVDSTPFLQARQMLAFPIGVLLAQKNKLGGWKKGMLRYSIIGILFGTGLYGLLHTSIINVENTPLLFFNFLSLFTCTVCALGIIGLVYSIKFLQNYGLIYISAISYELYIVHGYFIDLVSKNKSMIDLLLFIGLTLLCAIVLHWFTNMINHKWKLLISGS
jgi:peptidoglycan/LPS O-acetylase OafA/YrhL